MNLQQDEIPTIGVLVFQNNKVLLVKHTPKAEHLTGVYGLPSGRLKENETFIDAASREIEEETGLKVDVKDLIPLKTIFHAQIPRKSGEIAKMSWNVFVAIKYNGKVKPSDETTPEWIDINKVDQLPLLPNIKKAISEGLGMAHNTRC